MKCLLTGLLACGMMVGMTAVSTAANTQPTNKVAVAKTYRISQLHGTEVRNLQGQKLGTVDDFVMNMDKGTINYLALGTGGVLGIGEKLFAIPFNEVQLKFDGSTMYFVVNVAKSKLQNSKGFDKDHWPETAPAGFAGPLTRSATAPTPTAR